MEQFSTSSEYQFIKSVTPRMHQADESYKVNKAKLMRDVRLLRECLDGKIPPVTTNNSEQISNLILKCKRSKQIRKDDCPKIMGRDQFPQSSLLEEMEMFRLAKKNLSCQ